MKPFLPLLSLAAVLPLVAPSMARAANVKTYQDKAAFLADTGATSATGLLPNVGRVLDINTDPLATYTLGSLTFSLTEGSNNIAVGALDTPAEPDWYPDTDQNEIALGFERMQVATAGPVFSLGFDFIEPQTTMPPWGGVPIESGYEILLFDGTALVGQAQYAGTAIPNDVVTFLGVWSDVPFDRVLINDVTGDGDDEYFGEFFTGTNPGGCTLNLALSYSGGIFTMDFDVRTTAPTTWNLWFTYGDQFLIPFWNIPIPAVPVTASFPVAFALPPIGNVGVLTTLATAADGIQCSAFRTVDTTP
jgi:hypothetical protein